MRCESPGCSLKNNDLLMNEAWFYGIIQDSKPLIIQIKRPHSCSFYAIFYAHSKPIFPILTWAESDPHYLPTRCWLSSFHSHRP